MGQSNELRRHLWVKVFLDPDTSTAESRSFSPTIAFFAGALMGAVLTALLFNSSI